jgi:hypothetical protein
VLKKLETRLFSELAKLRYRAFGACDQEMGGNVDLVNKSTVRMTYVIGDHTQTFQPDPTKNTLFRFHSHPFVSNRSLSNVPSFADLDSQINDSKRFPQVVGEYIVCPSGMWFLQYDAKAGWVPLELLGYRAWQSEFAKENFGMEKETIATGTEFTETDDFSHIYAMGIFLKYGFTSRWMPFQKEYIKKCQLEKVRLVRDGVVPKHKLISV